MSISKSSSLAYLLTSKLQFHSSRFLYSLGTLTATVRYLHQACWDFLNQIPVLVFTFKEGEAKRLGLIALV